MTSDEAAIRELVATWHIASQAGDVETVLSLASDDVLFLRPGHPPMNREAFAAALQGFSGPNKPAIESEFAIQEVQVSGDLAYLWSTLQVTITPPGGGTPMRRAGSTLTIFRKQEGRWRLARDANMLAVVTA